MNNGQQLDANFDEIQQMWNQAIYAQLVTLQMYNTHNTLALIQGERVDAELCLQLLPIAQYQAQLHFFVDQAIQQQQLMLQVQLLQQAELQAQQAVNQALLAELVNIGQRQGADFDHLPEVIMENDEDDDEEGDNERIRQDVIQLRKQNDECAALGLRFSRACRVCHTEAPRERSACKPCGEAVCRECADASAEAGHQTCPKRREETGYVTLYEAVEERNEAGNIERPRACPLCMADSPRSRSFFINCGHIVCTACVGQMIVDPYDFACPFCRGDATYTLLQEELIAPKEEQNAQ